MTQIVEIGPEKIGPIWPHVRAHVESIAQSSLGKLTADDIAQLCMSGGVTMFVIIDGDKRLLATVLAEFAQYPRKKVCRIIGCVGNDKAKWLHHLTEIEDWARVHGCGAMQNIARKGWARDLKDYKWSHILLERDL